MSVQNAKDFLARVSVDEKVAEKVREAHEASLLTVAREYGFDIGAEDLREAMSEIALLDDLTVTEADEVVGGRSFTGRDSVW